MDADDFALPPEEDHGMWLCALLFSTLGGCLGYSFLTYLFNT